MDHKSCSPQGSSHCVFHIQIGESWSRDDGGFVEPVIDGDVEFFKPTEAVILKARVKRKDYLSGFGLVEKRLQGGGRTVLVLLVIMEEKMMETWRVVVMRMSMLIVGVRVVAAEAPRWLVVGGLDKVPLGIVVQESWELLGLQNPFWLR
ncbi:hypothetical protein Droror1_Dr00019826 [Drosera rotundifolia]